MLSAEARGRLVVVLVGARNPQNIGAAARAMHDFGFGDMRVVNEFAPPFEAAQLEASSAVNAGEVMRAARLYSSLPEAIADCSVVAGTTAVGGRQVNDPVLPLQDASETLRRQLAAGEDDAGRVALLFGSEKTGLTREQMSFCSLLVTIPMFAPEGRHLSMNLGQAVAVSLYELTREGFEGSRALPHAGVALATVDDRERLLELVREAMLRSGYARRFPANARVAVMRRLVGQMGATREEAYTWLGLLRLLVRSLPETDVIASLPDEGSENRAK